MSNTRTTQDVQLKQIVVNTPEEADEIIHMLRSRTNFEQLARQRSIDPTGERGGDLGFLGKDALNPAFEPWVFNQPAGAIVGPIASPFGFHVLKVAGQRPASDPITFEAARDEIMHALLLEKQQQASEALLAELRAASRVQVASSFAGMSLEPEPETPERTPGTFVPSGAASRIPLVRLIRSRLSAVHAFKHLSTRPNHPCSELSVLLPSLGRLSGKCQVLLTLCIVECLKFRIGCAHQSCSASRQA